MIINYQYNAIEFLPAGCKGTLAHAVELDDSNLERCFALLTTGTDNLRVVMHGSGARLLRYLKQHYIYVKAAGGIVRDPTGRLLLMQRNGRADLPKGKVEQGETLAAAALRETTEETGLSCLQLGPLRLKSYHIYDLYGGWHLKQTAWFDMLHTAAQPLVPQTDEGITALEWVSPDAWRSRLAQSYATMQVIIRQMTVN